MGEVARLQKKPWSFEEPFKEARILRPKLAA